MKSILKKLNISDTEIGKIKKIPWILGSYAFSIILIFILLNLILGEFLLYKYVSVKIEEPKIIGNTLKFEYNTYQKVLEEWQIREQKFEESPTEKYSNPFAPEYKNPINLK